MSCYFIEHPKTGIYHCFCGSSVKGYPVNSDDLRILSNFVEHKENWESVVDPRSYDPFQANPDLIPTRFQDQTNDDMDECDFTYSDAPSSSSPTYHPNDEDYSPTSPARHDQ
jgi:hypothetical protein